MKKFVYSFVLIAFVSFLFSCGGGNVEEQLIGEWTIEEASFQNLDEIVDAYKEYVGEMTEEEIEEFKQEMKDDVLSDIKGSKIAFKEDKTMSIDGEVGTWSLNDDKTVITGKNGDEVFEFNIESISKTSAEFLLVIKDDVDLKVTIVCKK